MHAQLCPTLCDPMDCSQVPLSMGFSRQEYWSGLPLLPAGDLPNPEIEPVSLASPALAGGFFPTVPPGSPIGIVSCVVPGVICFYMLGHDFLMFFL